MYKTSEDGTLLITNHIQQLIDYRHQGRVVFITLFTAFFAILPVGYNIVVLNVPETIIQQSINESFYTTFNIVLSPGALSILWSLTVASQSAGALIGCILVMPLERWYGTKTSLMVTANVVLLVSTVVMSMAQYLSLPPALIIGRALSGVHTGLSCAFVPMFIQEVAPPKIKGGLSCFVHISVCFGSAVAALLSVPFLLGSESAWGTLLLLPAISGITLLTASFFIPDTPNRLLKFGSYTQAIDSIRFYHEIECDDEDELVNVYWTIVPQIPEQMGLYEAVMSENRFGILLGIIVSATQIFSGSMVTISYSTSMFTSVQFLSSLVPFLPTLASIISIVLTLPSLQLVESCGRRSLLLYTLSLCVVSDLLLLIFSLAATEPDEWWASWGFAISFIIYGIGYNLGIGPIAYFIPAELVEPRAVSASLGASVAVNWLSTSITTFSYYPLNKAIGGWSYLMFLLPSSAALIVLWRWLPETRSPSRALSPTSTNPFETLPPPYGTFSQHQPPMHTNVQTSL